MIDLSPFCGDEPLRPNLHKPFTQGDFTYATDERILIRVPRRADVPEQDKPNVSKIMDAAGEKPANMVRIVELFSLPTIAEENCPNCEGTGHEHDCPDCVCKCESCDGKGRIAPNISISFRGGILAYKYYRMIAVLPGAAMPATIDDIKPIWFAFAGGDGLVCPMRSPYDNHVSVPETTDV